MENNTNIDVMLNPATLEKAAALFKAQLDFFESDQATQNAINSLSALGNTGNVQGRTRVYKAVCLILAGQAPKPNKAPVISLDWVLNELAGMSFPEPGAAYDYIEKRILRK